MIKKKKESKSEFSYITGITGIAYWSLAVLVLLALVTLEYVEGDYNLIFSIIFLLSFLFFPPLPIIMLVLNIIALTKTNGHKKSIIFNIISLVEMCIYLLIFLFIVMMSLSSW